MTNQPFVADFYSTDGITPRPGVLVLGGAEGGKPDGLARLFADRGYPVLSLAYFGVKGTPDHLDMISLEYFAPSINWLATRPEVRGGAVVAVGASKGAELALLLASKNPRIKGVIAIAPSSVVWQGIPKIYFPPRSSWSLDGKSISYVSYDYSKGFPNPSNLLAIYSQSLTQTSAVAAAAIEVEKINGPILMLCGTSDNLWPSETMGQAIIQRLKDNNFKYDYQLVKYPDAGHTLNERAMIGGTPEGNQKAGLDSAEKMLEFLSKSSAGTTPTTAQ